MRDINLDNMANGYREMAKINLMISREFFNLENEVMLKGDACIEELDRKKTEGNT